MAIGGNEEVDRLRDLRQIGILDTPPEPAFDRLAQMAARAAGAPIALISFVDEKRQWFKANVGLSINEPPQTISFCGHAVASRSPLLVRDALEDPRFKDNPLVLSAPAIRAYFGFPVFSRDHHALGTLCVMDQKPRALSTKSQRLLQALARQVEVEIERFRRANALHQILEGSPQDAGLEHSTLNVRVRLLPKLEIEQLSGPVRRVLDRAPIMTPLPTAESRRLLHSQDRELLTFLARRPGNLPDQLALRWRAGSGKFRWLTHTLKTVVEDGLAVGVQGTAERYRVKQAHRSADSSTTPRPDSDPTAGLNGLAASRLRLIDELEELHRQKSELLALAVHDIKSPLTSILANAEMLLADALDLSAREALQDILSSAEELQRLTFDMLDIGSAERGRFPLNLNLLDLRDPVKRVVARFHSTFERAQQVLRLDVPDAAVEAQVDEHAYCRVLQNLLDNAHRYAPMGTAVRVRLSSTEHNARLSVANHGTRIPETLRDAIFEPYTRAPSDSHGSGHGLGLTFCRKAVSAHGGRIWTDEDPCDGTLFVFEVPRAPNVS